MVAGPMVAGPVAELAPSGAGTRRPALRAGSLKPEPRLGRPARIATPRRPATPGSSLRLTVRGRVVLSLVAVACCLGLGAVAGSVADASSPAHGVDVVRHTVVSGETLWGVARSVAGKGDDVRDVVADIESLNRLAGPGLRAGQVIWLPAHH